MGRGRVRGGTYRPNWKRQADGDHEVYVGNRPRYRGGVDVTLERWDDGYDVRVHSQKLSRTWAGSDSSEVIGSGLSLSEAKKVGSEFLNFPEGHYGDEIRVKEEDLRQFYRGDVDKPEIRARVSDNYHYLADRDGNEITSPVPTEKIYSEYERLQIKNPGLQPPAYHWRKEF